MGAALFGGYSHIHSQTRKLRRCTYSVRGSCQTRFVYRTLTCHFTKYSFTALCHQGATCRIGDDGKSHDVASMMHPGCGTGVSMCSMLCDRPLDEGLLCTFEGDIAIEKLNTISGDEAVSCARICQVRADDAKHHSDCTTASEPQPCTKDCRSSDHPHFHYSAFSHRLRSGIGLWNLACTASSASASTFNHCIEEGAGEVEIAHGCPEIINQAFVQCCRNC